MVAIVPAASSFVIALRVTSAATSVPAGSKRNDIEVIGAPR